MSNERAMQEVRGPDIPTPPPRNPFKLIGAAIVVLIIAWFLGRSIWTRWDVIAAHAWRLDWVRLAVSATVAWLAFAVLVGLWRLLLLTTWDRPLSYSSAYRISALANLGKYIPGKVWSVMGIVYFLRREGYPPAAALTATVLHQAFTVISGAVFVGVILGHEFWGQMPLAPVIIGLGLSLLVLYPPFFRGAVNRGLRFLRREPIAIRLSFTRAVTLFVAYLAAWTIYGSALWFLLQGLGLAPGNFWEIAATFTAAYLAGFLALFAPGGLGVREGVLTLLLAPHIGAGIAALVAVVARIWMTVVELLQLSPALFGKPEPQGYTEDHSQ